jgi:hypothetical protein
MMAERLIELDGPFSTADTEGGVKIVFGDSELSLVFMHWCLVEHRVILKDVAAFKWDDSDLANCAVAPEGVYQVEGSAWVASLRDVGRIGSAEPRHHFRFYLNSEGAALDVIASSFASLS